MIDQTTLHKLMYSKDVKERQTTLHKLLHSEDAKERQIGIVDLYRNFADLPDKSQACKEIHRLIQDEDRNMRMCAARSIGIAFPYCTNKKQVWDDIIMLIKNDDSLVQHWAANSVCIAFPYISDKKQAWKDIIQLVNEEKNKVLRYGTRLLGNVFRYVDDKNQAWKDLILLAKSGNMFMRSDAINALGVAFRYVDDKNQAWEDLHWLTIDESSGMQMNIAEILGDIFPSIPDKNQAYDDLNRLSLDEIRGVRQSANYSLGRVSIFRANESDTEEDFKKELENALKFFEKSANEASNSDFLIQNPARFCLPFYRSFYAITFKKQDAKLEVQKSLNEAKNAVEGSESKEKLLKFMENLEKALKEAQKAKNLNSKKCDLNVIRMYCENAGNLLDAVKERAPLAAEVMRKGMPIIKKNIRELLDEIQKKAKDVCQQSRGTPAENVACAVNEEVQGWYYVSDQKQMVRNNEKLFFLIGSKIPSTSENRHIHDKIEEIRNEKDILIQSEWLIALIGLIPSANIHAGDNITVSSITASGENIQVVVKGNENKNVSEGISSEVKERTWTTWFSPHATYAAFIGFLATEIGTYLYPTTYNHLISVVIAVLTFVIVAIFNKRRRPQRRDSF